MRHFRLPVVAALAFAVAVPAAALAAKPKHGYYIDAPKQIYVVVNA